MVAAPIKRCRSPGSRWVGIRSRSPQYASLIAAPAIMPRAPSTCDVMRFAGTSIVPASARADISSGLFDHATSIPENRVFFWSQRIAIVFVARRPLSRRIICNHRTGDIVVKVDTEKKTFKLSYPLEHDGRTITEIALGRPKLRDIVAAQKFKTPAEQSVGMIASISGIPIPALMAMDASDFVKLDGYFGPLFARMAAAEETGDTPQL